MSRANIGTRPPGIAPRHRLWLAAIGIVFATITAYRPAIDGGFIWDDDDYVTDNALLQSGAGLVQIWEPGHTHQYYPAVFTTFWAEYHIWGLNPVGYHVVNVLLHIANALLLWRLLSLLGVPGAWMISAVFALHPMNVESVAWITERKNVLSGLFYLSAALAYLRFDPMRDDGERNAPGAPEWKAYGLSLFLFILALLSKSVTCSLPAAIVLALLLRRQRLGLKRLLPLVPMFLIGAVAALHTAVLERTSVGARGAEFDFSWVERGLIATRALLHYPVKLLIPHPLIFIYPRWTIDAGAWQAYWPLLLVLAIGVSSVVAFMRGWRGPAIALAFYAVTILPALGFVDYWPMVYSFVADHFAYLASIGLIALVVAPLADRWGEGHLAKGLAAVVLLVLGGLSWQQGHKYANEETLWRTTIAANPGAWMAYNNLGVVYLRDYGRLDQAAGLVRDGDLRRAVDVLRSSPSAAVHDLAGTLRGLTPDRGAAAVTVLERMRQPLMDQAISEFKASLEINADNVQATGNLAVAMHRLGRYDEALAYWQALMAHGTATPDDRYGMGLTLEALGRTDEAVADYREILEESPGHLAARLHLGQLLAAGGRHEEATEQFKYLVERYPGSVKLQLYLGERAGVDGDWSEAIDHYQTALKYVQERSDAVELARRLATIFTTCPDRRYRDAPAALRLLDPWLRDDQADPALRGIRAAAQAELGRFDEAIADAEQALAVARARGLDTLVTELETHLGAYRRSSGAVR